MRKGTLELTVSGKKLVIKCGRENKLFGFGEGRGLMVTWEKEDGIDKTVRLLGSFGLEHSYGYDLDGKSYFENDSIGLIEISRLGETLAKTAVDTCPALLK